MYTMKWACKKVGRPLLSLLAVAAASLLIYWWHILSPYMHLPAVTDDQLDALDLSGYTKILFSAHPDDELIWGGGHLLDDKYLVVCMTGGNNPVRSKEFQSVVTETGGKYLMLSYPDKLGNKRSSWKYWRAAMEKDVATNLLWSMIPETKAFCPRGLGMIPYQLPSSVELADATIKELADYDVVMWEKHGIFAVDRDVMAAFDQIDVLNKSALIYIAAKNMGFEPDGMSQEQMKEMSVAFNLPK